MDANKANITAAAIAYARTVRAYRATTAATRPRRPAAVLLAECWTAADALREEVGHAATVGEMADPYGFAVAACKAAGVRFPLDE